MATKPEGIHLETIQMEISVHRHGQVHLALQRYDNVSSWQEIDHWSWAVEENSDVPMAEAMFGWEAFATALLRSRGIEVTLPFP